MIALYFALFSVGEAFYSPRVYEYAAAIAPQRPGSFRMVPFRYISVPARETPGRSCERMAVSHFLSRAMVRDIPGAMWLIFALAASIAPIGLLLFRRYIRVPEQGRHDP